MEFIVTVDELLEKQIALMLLLLLVFLVLAILIEGIAELVVREERLSSLLERFFRDDRDVYLLLVDEDALLVLIATVSILHTFFVAFTAACLPIELVFLFEFLQ